MQPESIRKFTLFYLGSLALSLVATFVGYEVLSDQVERAGVGGGSTALIGGVVLNVAITLLLWYLVARKGFAVAKWIVILLFLFSLVTGLQGIAAGGLALHEIISLLAVVAQAVAVYFLFQPDAKAWFSRPGPAEPAADE